MPGIEQGKNPFMKSRRLGFVGGEREHGIGLSRTGIVFDAWKCGSLFCPSAGGFFLKKEVRKEPAGEVEACLPIGRRSKKARRNESTMRVTFWVQKVVLSGKG